jgi:hypothetical protein
MHTLLFLVKSLRLWPFPKLINPLKSKLVQMLFKNSVRTSKRTQHFTITKLNWLTLFKEINAVYSENHKNT